ncbi:DDT domain-containing protein [Drechmeria coniospora]|uniref:DDT domain-containing protein n=1 Tax=Drechmeria coniospora TaxID=98403 RepID=A0A151GXR6_DRECN|nr:DDT domain-containing protein [Drechmeria coniospora]KYK61861.1 DDT domain-containing protein [Drechmeria coniospora]
MADGGAPGIQPHRPVVWHIPQTGEVFTSYEAYLKRMDFYKQVTHKRRPGPGTPWERGMKAHRPRQQRRFNDQITGHSGLTFFEAFSSEVRRSIVPPCPRVPVPRLPVFPPRGWHLFAADPPASQLAGGREVEAAFPEALKGPILRKVQFQIVSRLDNLVDMIYDEFKRDFYPGEEVTVTMDGGERVHGLVRDKTTFGPRILSDGSRSQPVTRYHVNLKDTEDESMVTDEHICRDRGIFTKAMLRSFIKKTVAREAWNGAPWLVKHEYANQYHIDTRVPPHLRHDTKLQERKQLQARKRAAAPPDVNGHGSHLQSGPVRLPELKPAPKSQKGKHGQHPKAIKWPLGMSVNGAHAVNGVHAVNGGTYPPGHYRDHRAAADPTPTPPPPPPPPPPKYPIEDLQLEPREGSVRPRLRFMCRDPPVEVDDDDGAASAYGNIDMASVGSLLETWDSLNVYCEIFQLDSFTFDDFVEAMQVASTEVPVQLFDEIHCSVLKILVDSEKDGGRVRITLPELEEVDAEAGDDDDDDDAETAEPEPEPAPKPSGRATRGSLAKLEAERLAAEAAAAEEETLRAELESKHRADELLRGYDWIEHLRRRDFARGGWERIVVGLLHQLSKQERYETVCEELLHQLVPPGTEPTQEAVQERYGALDVNHRVRALQLLCMLTMETKAVRGFMEDCSETMTKYRKERIEWQRQRKQATEDLRQLNDERKALLPEGTPSEEAAKVDEDGKAADLEDSQLERDDEAEVSNDERKAHAPTGRIRQAAEKQRRREEEKERLAKEKKELAEKARKEAVKLPGPQMKQYNKLLKEIQKKEGIIKECEVEMAIIENDLREADCPRTRVLGKDRFWNRYYWFERNGMPYGGLPNSSTADAEYANGCLWVQGPDELEREGYIDAPAELQDEYRARFKMTIPERKATEEGGTSVFNARQWGYLSEAEDVERLIHWLDPRGFNELKLRKELVHYKERIATHMRNRGRYLKAEAEDEVKEEAVVKRTSSRIRERTPEARSYRCARWVNTMALDELGHLHSHPPPPPRAKKQSRKREAAAEPTGRGANKARRK